MVNALKYNLSPLPVGKYSKSTKNSRQRRHQANNGGSGLEAERVRALGALCSLQSKKKLSAERRRETHILSKEDKEKWIEDYVDRETAVARKRVQDADTAIIQEPEHMTNVEKARVTTRKPETTFEEMLNAIRDSLGDLRSAENEEDGEDEVDNEEDTELGKLSKDDEPGQVMGTISKTVRHRMESFWQKQLRVDELTQPGWGEVAHYFTQRDVMYGLTEFKVPAVVKPKTDTTAATPSPTTSGEHIQIVDIVPVKSKMPQVMSRHGSSQMRLGSVNPLPGNHIPSLMPHAVTNSSQKEIAMPVQPLSIYPSV